EGFGDNGAFGPEPVKAFQSADHGASTAGGQSAMKLDHHPDVRPNGLPNRSDQVHGRLGLRGRHVFPGGAERIELEGWIAAADHVTCPLRNITRRLCPAVPAVPISRYALR